MAQRKAINSSIKLKPRRTFSESFKREKVHEIETGITRVCEICKEYEVSTTAVYKWIHKYSKNMKKTTKTIVETQSDTRKLQALKQKVADLERMLGQKQIEVDFMSKMIELAEEEYEIDIKKNFGGEPSSGFGKTENK